MPEPSTFTRPARRPARRLPASLHGAFPWSARALGVRRGPVPRPDAWAPGGLCARLLAPSDAGRPSICAVEGQA
jgi:hypothetical protein